MGIDFLTLRCKEYLLNMQKGVVITIPAAGNIESLRVQASKLKAKHKGHWHFWTELDGTNKVTRIY